MMKEYHFTGGRTPPESLPVQGLIDAAARVLKRRGELLVHYPSQFDYHDELKKVASKRFEHREGTPLPLEDILVTTGSMQAITLPIQALTKPGDTIVTEELTYMGSLECFRHYGLKVEGVPLDSVNGMDMDTLEDTLRSLAARGIKPRFIYPIPNYQNPTGAVLSLPRRKRLIELAQEYGVLVLEDDCYGDTDLEPVRVPPSLYTLGDPQTVLFLGSFSKILAPGVRLGYLCTPQRFLPQLLGLKRHAQDAGTSGLSSFIVADYLRDNLWSHIERHTRVIREKRDTTLGALEEHFGDCATWTRPRGGLVIWVELPFTADMDRLEQLAEERGVRYTRGREFHARGEDIKCLRLSYAHMPHEDIREGVRLLAECVREAS
jgi:2-aminoadipate transaminase